MNNKDYEIVRASTGGQAFPTFDYDLAPYVAKSFISNFIKCLKFDDPEIDSKIVQNIKQNMQDYYDKHNTLIDDFDAIHDIVVDDYSIPLQDLKRCFDFAHQQTVDDTYQAMEAFIHNMNSMHSRCIEENQEVISLDIHSSRDVDKMSEIEKNAFKELLILLYEEHTIDEISKELNLTKKIVSNIFKKLNIKARSPVEKANFNKKIYLRKFGVDNPMKDKSIQRKVELAQKEKNNGKYAFNTDKQKETMMHLYGVSNIMQNPDMLNKMISNNIKKYGVGCTLQVPNVKEKAEKTCLTKYGAKNVLSKNSSIFPNENFKTHPERIPKAHETVKNRYGNLGIGSEKIKRKIESTNIEKYQCKNPGLKCASGKSKAEIVVVNYIRNKYPNIRLARNIRSMFECNHRYEVDIYLPDLKIGFEVDGDFSHDKYSYLNDLSNNTVTTKERFKELEALSNGFELFNLWEDDIYENFNKVASVIDKAIENKEKKYAKN